jgi:C1A family cysteine protease
MVTRSPTKYGCRPDIPDVRDYVYALPRAIASTPQPRGGGLRDQCPPVVNQGQLGSCTANAWTSLLQFLFMQSKKPTPALSRLWLYYQERVIDGTVNTDAGAAMRDGMTVLRAMGCPPESLWAYDIAKFAVPPPQPLMSQAALYKMFEGHRIDSTQPNLVRGCLAAQKPFVCGFSVYESFESAAVSQGGLLPMPKPGEQLLGMHAVMGCGYNDNKRIYEFKNSYGNQWGLGGYFWMHYDFVHNANLVVDMWTGSLTV